MIAWDRLNELRAEIGDDDLADVVAMFLEEADEVVAGNCKRPVRSAARGTAAFPERQRAESGPV